MSSQERKIFGDDFPQLSNDYFPAKKTPPLATKLIDFSKNYYFSLTLPLSFLKHIFMRFCFNKIWGKGFVVWLLSKTVVLKISELPGELAHTQRFSFSGSRVRAENLHF